MYPATPWSTMRCLDRDVEEHRAEIGRQNRTTAVVALVVVVGVVVALVAGGPEADTAPVTSTTSVPADTTTAVPDGPVVELGTSGAVVVGRGGEAPRTVACCFDELLESSEPGHVWAITDGDAAMLVDLGRGPTGIVLELDGHRVLGLAPFGLVTVGADGRPVWRRPDFAPSPVDIPAGCEPRSAGGGFISCRPSDGTGIHRQRIADLVTEPARGDG